MPDLVDDDAIGILVHMYESVFNANNLSLANQFIAEDVIDHWPVPGQLPGLDGVKAVFNRFHKAFPDVRITVDTATRQSDLVVARMLVTGTHLGSFLNYPATGRRICVPAIDFVRIAGGRIVERWGIMDELGILAQLGIPLAGPV